VTAPSRWADRHTDSSARLECTCCNRLPHPRSQLPMLRAQVDGAVAPAAFLRSPVRSGRDSSCSNSRNRQKVGVHHVEVTQALEHVGVFIVLNTVRIAFRRIPGADSVESDRCWRIDEDSVTRSAPIHTPQAARVHIVPAADSIPPAVQPSAR